MAISQRPSWVRIFIASALVIIWFAAAGFSGPYFGKIGEVASNDLATFLPGSAEATKANQEIEKFRDSKTLPALIVFEKPTELSDSDTTKIDALRAQLQKLPEIKGTISPPIIADEKKAALLVLPLERDEELKKILPTIESKVVNAQLAMTYKIGGPASFAKDLQKAFGAIDVTLLGVALGVVFIILLVVYRSPLLPFIVLITAMSALAVSVCTVWYLADAGIVQLNGQVQGILFILVIGAATDYSLLYLARLREELHNYTSMIAATKAALKGSYESIIAAGGTVTLGLMCLLLSDLGSNKALGPVGGIGIAFAVLASLTLLPAILLLFGRSAFWPRRPEYDPAHEESYKSRYKWWAKIGALVIRRPRRIWVGVSAVLIVACFGVLQLKADGVPQSELVLGRSEARDAQAIIDKHFASGSGSPVYIITAKEHRDKIIEQLDKDKNVDSLAIAADNVSSGSMPVGEAKQVLDDKIKATITADREQKLRELRQSLETSMVGAPPMIIEQAYQSAASRIPSVETIASQASPFKDAIVKEKDGEVLIEATLNTAADSEEARSAVVRIREAVHKVHAQTLVGGVTAIQYDTNQAALVDRATIIPLVLAVITVILGILLRSLIAPIILLLTTLVSFGATLGIAALLFNNVLHLPGSDPSVILFGFIFLVALGIDYNIFLMTRVREEVLKTNMQTGTIKALIVTGGVITSAGIVLAATFAALGVIPILFLVQIAFIVAFGVVLDTIIVRSLLVPALTLELGKFMWWPSKASPKKSK